MESEDWLGILAVLLFTLLIKFCVESGNQTQAMRRTADAIERIADKYNPKTEAIRAKP